MLLSEQKRRTKVLLLQNARDIPCINFSAGRGLGPSLNLQRSIGMIVTTMRLSLTADNYCNKLILKVLWLAKRHQLAPLAGRWISAVLPSDRSIGAGTSSIGAESLAIVRVAADRPRDCSAVAEGARRRPVDVVLRAAHRADDGAIGAKGARNRAVIVLITADGPDHRPICADRAADVAVYVQRLPADWTEDGSVIADRASKRLARLRIS